MGNCLKTQLKESVDNNNLFKMGEFAITFDVAEAASDDYLAISVLYDIAASARVINGTFMDDTYTSPEGTTKSINAEEVTVLRVSNTGATLILSDKYNIKYLNPITDSYDHKGISFNINELKYTTFDYNLYWKGLTDIKGDINNIKGNLNIINLINCFGVSGSINGSINPLNTFICNSKDINGLFANSFISSNAATLTNVQIQNSNIIDNIANIPLMDNLTELILSDNNKLSGYIDNLNVNNTKNIEINLSYTAVEGTLEGFANNCITNGRTSGTITIIGTSSGITYNGETFEGTKTIIFSNGSYSVE